MYAYGIPMKLQERAWVLALRLKDQIRSLSELGLDLVGKDRHLLDMRGVDRVCWVAAHLREKSGVVTINRLLNALEVGEEIFTQAKKLERRYLLSDAVVWEMRERIWRNGPPNRHVGIACVKWGSLRKAMSPTCELREAYLALLAAVAAAEREAEALSIIRTLSQNTSLRVRRMRRAESISSFSIST